MNRDFKICQKCGGKGSIITYSNDDIDVGVRDKLLNKRKKEICKECNGTGINKS